MTSSKNTKVLKSAWDALGSGDWDALAAFYSEDMIFVIPGQNDVLRGRSAFRSAVENIGEALPPGFEITDLRYFSGESDDELVNIVEWTSSKLQGGSQSAILWRFNEAGEITEERWYVDTEHWKSVF